jgi:hypothetical protein
LDRNDIDRSYPNKFALVEPPAQATQTELVGARISAVQIYQKRVPTRNKKALEFREQRLVFWLMRKLKNDDRAKPFDQVHAATQNIELHSLHIDLMQIDRLGCRWCGVQPLVEANKWDLRVLQPSRSAEPGRTAVALNELHSKRCVAHGNGRPHRLDYVIEAVVVNVLLKSCEMVLHRLKGDDRSRRTDSSAERYWKGSNTGSDVDHGVVALNQAKRGGEIRALMHAKFLKIRRDEVPFETGKGAVGSFDALGFHAVQL